MRVIHKLYYHIIGNDTTYFQQVQLYDVNMQAAVHFHGK